MSAQTELFAALSTVLCFAAVLFGTKWIGPAWDAYTRRHIADITPRLRALGMDETAVRRYLRLWGIAIFTTLVLVGVVLAMVPVALGLAYLVFIAPRHILDYQVRRRNLLLRDQLVRASVGLANASRAGLSLPQGIGSVCDDTPEPLASEFRRVVRDHKSGRPISDALRDVQRRLQLESFTVFASSILVCLEHGGRVTYALERISTGLQELQRLERKLEADSAAGRKLSLLLGLFPLFFLAGFTVLDPVSMDHLYNTLPGQFVLLGVGIIVFLAVKWCVRILDIDM